MVLVILPPPQRNLPVLQKLKTTYKRWIVIHRNMPRTERSGIGQKIDGLFLELLEQIRKAEYMAIGQKIIILEKILTLIDSLRFFLQIAWEIKQIPNNQYIVIGKEVENIGKMIGGWRKSLLTKTPAN